MHERFPLPDTEWDGARPFWEGAARHQLVLPRCDGCGGYRWYPTETCRHCGSSGMTWTATSGRGVLFSWTVVRHPFLRQFATDVPFATGLVTLDDDPRVRMATRLVDCELDELRFDMPVEAVFRPLTFPDVEGDVVAPFFRRVQPGVG